VISKRINGILSFFSFCDVCSADYRSIFHLSVERGVEPR